MKTKYLLPFALTTLMAALSGCGGESANIIPEKYDSSTASGYRDWETVALKRVKSPLAVSARFSTQRSSA